MNLQTDVSVALTVKEGTLSSAMYKDEQDISLPGIEVLNSFRTLIAGARTGNIEIPDDVSRVSYIYAAYKVIQASLNLGLVYPRRFCQAKAVGSISNIG